jgi:hypothetical protein
MTMTGASYEDDLLEQLLRRRQARQQRDTVLPGQGVRVPLLLLDGASHRPHQVVLSDEDRSKSEEAYDKMCRRMTNAWKDPPPQTFNQDPGPALPADPNLSAAENAARKHDKTISENWRKGPNHE